MSEMEENVCVLREVCVLHAVKDFILLLCAIFLVPSNVVVKIKKSIPLKYILLNYCTLQKPLNKMLIS